MLVKLEGLEKELEGKLSWAIEAKRMESIEDSDNEKYAKEMVANNYLESIIYEDLIGECFGLLIKLEKAIEKCSSTSKRSELLFNGRLSNLNKALKLIDLECNVTFNEILTEIEEDAKMEDNKQEDVTMDTKNTTTEDNKEKDLNMNTTTEKTTTNTTTTTEGEKEMNTTTATTGTENKKGGVNMFKEGKLDFINNKYGRDTTKKIVDELLKTNASKKEQIKISKEIVLNEIEKAGLVRLFTNQNSGKEEDFRALFANLLYLVSNGGAKVNVENKTSEEEFVLTPNQLDSLHISASIGKAAEAPEKDTVAVYSHGQIGENKMNIDTFIEQEVRKAPKNGLQNIDANKLNELDLMRIMENKALLNSSKETTFSAYEFPFFAKIDGLCQQYPVTLSVSGSERNKNGIVTRTVQVSDEAGNQLILPIVEFLTIGKTKLIKWGNDVYSGSTMLTKADGTQVFLDCENTILRLFESYIKNMSNDPRQDATLSLFNSKDEDEDKASLFVRIESLNKMFLIFNEETQEWQRIDYDVIESCGETINTLLENKDIKLDNIKKMDTLIGNCHLVKDLAFDKIVNKNLEMDSNDEFVLETHGHTLGGGAGLTGLLYRVVNNANAWISTPEERVKSNLFSMIFGVTKASRYNNSTLHYITNDGNLRINNCYGEELPVYTKVASTVFINTTKLDKTGKVMLVDAFENSNYSNLLDCYISDKKVANGIFGTVSGNEDRKQYILSNIPDDDKEMVWNYVLLVAEAKAKGLKGLALKEAKQQAFEESGMLMMDTSRAKYMLRKLRDDVKKPVWKCAIDFLKGDYLTLVNEDIKFTSESCNEAETKFINDTLVISNEVLKKPEFGHAMELHNQIKEQIKAGKREFEVKQPAVTSEPNPKDLVKGTLTVNGFEFECLLKYCSINIHDHKNSYVSQGSTCAKEMFSNIQDNSATRHLGTKPLAGLSGVEREFAYQCANRKLVRGKYIELSGAELEGLTIYCNSNSKVVRSNVEKIASTNKMTVTTNLETASIIYNGTMFGYGKNLIMDSNGRVIKFVEDVNGDQIVLKKVDRKYLTLQELSSLRIKQHEILTKEELNKVVHTKEGIKTVLQIITYLVSKDLTNLTVAIPTLLGKLVSTDNALGILEALSSIKAIEVDNGKYVIFSKRMRKITKYFPKELNVMFQLCNSVETFKNTLDEEVINRVFDGEINNLNDYFEAYKHEASNLSIGSSFICLPKESLTTKFDLEHHVELENGMVAILTKEIKKNVIELTVALNQMVKFHEERLFTKNAKKLLSDTIPSFYATLIAGHIPQNEVRVNPNSEGFSLFMKKKNKGVLLGRFPTTGEKGIGLKLVFDYSLPENTIMAHPAIIEQLMGDTDGDMGYILLVPSNYCKKFTALEFNEKEYFKLYEHKTFFKKCYDSEGNFKPFDLTYEGALKRNEDYRIQSLFNPEFVGTITSKCMFFANNCYKIFIEDLRKQGDEELKAKGIAIYEFFIRVVQKQLSQIPIAAKNTDTAALKDFSDLWSSFSAGNCSIDEITKFITVTGWDNEDSILTGKNIYFEEETEEVIG